MITSSKLAGGPSPLGKIREALALALGAGRLDIPLLPEAAVHLMAPGTRPAADAESLRRLIESDRALAAQVMRVSASAACQPDSRIGSLQHAIAWLGPDEVADIAFTAAVQGRLLGAPGHESLIIRSWRASVMAALWSREIATVARAPAEPAYLCGLLHQIGRPVTVLVAADLALARGERLTEGEYAWLMDDMGGVVGEEVARRWGLPPAVMSCIRWWRDPANAAEHRVEVRTVALANRLAQRCRAGGAGLALDTLDVATVLAELGVAPDRFNSLLDRAEWVLAQARAY